MKEFFSDKTFIINEFWCNLISFIFKVIYSSYSKCDDFMYFLTLWLLRSFDLTKSNDIGKYVCSIYVFYYVCKLGWALLDCGMHV